MNPDNHWHLRLTRAFLWLGVVSWGIALGAATFDLVVVASAWGASPPSSFQFLPYGKAYPIDPGNFFQPLSALLLVFSIGGLITGWKTSSRSLMLIALSSFLVIWILTPTVFWPMINDLWAIHKGRLAATDAEAMALVRRWFIWDSGRIVLIGVGFIYTVRALGLTAQTKLPDAEPNASNGVQETKVK